MRKLTFWFPTWSDTNQAVQLQKMASGLKFRIKKVEECTIYVAKIKALISFAVYKFCLGKIRNKMKVSPLFCLEIVKFYT